MKTKNLREQGKVVFIKQMKTKGAEKGINVNTNMYNFACVRMYKITRFLALNEPLIDKNHLQWLRQLRDVKYDLKSHSLV